MKVTNFVSQYSVSLLFIFAKTFLIKLLTGFMRGGTDKVPNLNIILCILEVTPVNDVACLRNESDTVSRFLSSLPGEGVTLSRGWGVALSRGGG